MSDYELFLSMKARAEKAKADLATSEQKCAELAAAINELQKSTNWEAVCGASVKYIGPQQNYPDPAKILATYRAQVERATLAKLIGEASLIGWTGDNPPLAHYASVEDAEAWLERDRARVERETLTTIGSLLGLKLCSCWEKIQRRFAPAGGSNAKRD